MGLMQTNNPHRPTCPSCGRELVFAALVFGGIFFQTWMCDCATQPLGVGADIVKAREWDQYALVYEVEKLNEQPFGTLN